MEIDMLHSFLKTDQKKFLLDKNFVVFSDLAIQVAGSWKALEDREGEMIEKRVFVNGVFHFRNLSWERN